jgi:hypothetical protein
MNVSTLLFYIIFDNKKIIAIDGEKNIYKIAIVVVRYLRSIFYLMVLIINLSAHNLGNIDRNEIYLLIEWDVQ